MYFPHVIRVLNFHPLFQSELSPAITFFPSPFQGGIMWFCLFVFFFFNDKLFHLLPDSTVYP